MTRRVLCLRPHEADHVLKERRSGCPCGLCRKVTAMFASRLPLGIVVRP